jgi:glycosyltransferase involved in cell wall biosynthesis
VQELADHYRLSDVFAMPSTGEGFGIAFLEAMACGVPCVAGNADGSRDALDHGRLGFLVDPRDPAAVAKGIESALAVGKDRVLEPEGRRLHEEVRRCFGNDVFAQRLRLALQSFGNLEGR